MERMERLGMLAKQVLNLLRSHLSHGLWVEYTAYCSQFFGLQMAYESSILSVLPISWCYFPSPSPFPPYLLDQHLFTLCYPPELASNLYFRPPPPPTQIIAFLHYQPV